MWGVFVSWMNVTANQLRMSGGGATPFENAKSLEFDGVDDYVDMDETILLSDFNYPSAYTSDVSCSFWYKRETSGVHNLFYIGNPNFSYGRLIGFIFVNNDLRIGFLDNQRATISTPPDSLWHHLFTTIINNGGGSYTLKCYLDDTEVVNTTITGLSTSITTTGLVATIARTGNGSYDFPGKVDEIALWNSDQSANASTIYNSGTPIDLRTYSPSFWLRMGDGDTFPILTDNGSVGSDGTMRNMTSGDIVTDVPPNPFNNKSILFDGTDDFISTGYSYDATVTPNFSMSFWIKTTSTGLFKFPVAMSAGGGNYTNSVVMVYGSQLLIDDRSGWNFGTSTSINNGVWHNIIVTAEYSGSTTTGTELNIYLDGNLTPDLHSATMKTGTNSYLSGDLYMGSYDGAGEFFNGNVDEVAVWESILSSADITAIYNSGVPNDLSSLNPIGYWRNGDGDTFPNIKDHGFGGNDGVMNNMTSGDIVTDVP